MRQLFLISVVAAIAALSALAYQVVGRTGRAPEPAKDQAIAAPPVRSIPIRPREGADPTPTPSAKAGDSTANDRPGDVAGTLGELRPREAAEGSDGPVLVPAQIAALKAQAERRHMRPVTRMTFPLEPGTTVPPQVYLHPTPPELAGLGSAGDPLGFIQVGDTFVLVGTVSRRIVAVAKG